MPRRPSAERESQSRVTPSEGEERLSADAGLDHARERFVALWGQMGSTWGIPRAMAQVHAVLFIVGEPMNTDDVMEALSISRGSASTTLRQLVEWGIVSRVHKRGVRKEYFQAEQDVWKMLRTVLAERKKREVDPLLEALEACRPAVDERRIGPGADAVRGHNARLDRLLAVMRLVDAIGGRFISPTGEGLEHAARLLDRAS